MRAGGTRDGDGRRHARRKAIASGGVSPAPPDSAPPASAEPRRKVLAALDRTFVAGFSTALGVLAALLLGALVLIGALAGGALMGVLGVLIALPVMASILLVIREVVVPRQNLKT